MADKKTSARQSVASTPRSSTASKGFTPEERAAMREHAQELKAARSGPHTAAPNDVAAVLAKIASMQPADRAMGQRVHAIVTAAAPGLVPRLWYGMPAYAGDSGVVCFFQESQKFKTRYSTLGFSDKARLDDGAMWPTAFALTELTAADEARISALVKKAAR